MHSCLIFLIIITIQVCGSILCCNLDKETCNGYISLHVFVLFSVAEYALKYGNACNSVLRVAACTYQERVMKRDCETGKMIEEEEEEEKRAGERRIQEQVKAEEQIHATGDSFFGQSASEQEEVCSDPLDGQCQN